MNKTTTKRYSVSGLTPHDTLRNAKSDLDAAFDAANDATKGLVTALSRTDNALYSALQTIYEFVKEGEARPEEFEEFKRARGIKGKNNARSIFQPYVKFFITKNTGGKDIIGRASKYGAALDEAREQGIDVDELSKWLKSQGIEKICKERRRRNSPKDPQPEPKEEAVKEATDLEGEAGAIPSPEGVKPPLSETTVRHVLKLSGQAEQCTDPEERLKTNAILDKLATPLKIDGERLVAMAEECILMGSIKKWGDDERAREIGRLRVLLHRHGISC
jgi:hypothetical protein